MKLAHTMIRVRDLDRSIDFYSNFLGLREARRKDLGDAVLVFLADEDEHQHLDADRLEICAAHTLDHRAGGVGPDPFRRAGRVLNAPYWS